MAGLLLGQVQTEAQAGGVDPGVDDLAQPPCSPGLGQGVCDLGQASGFTDPGETVPLLGEADLGGMRGAGDVLVTVQNHLRTERRMPAHLDRQMSPGRVHDVEGVVVDELPGLLQIADLARGRRAGHLPHRRRRPRHQDQEHADPDGVVAQIVLCDPMLAFPRGAVDHRHAVRTGPAAHPPGEPAGQPHQVRVVQRVVAVGMPAAPPDPEPARVVTQRVRVQHDPVHTVVAAAQRIDMARGESIHLPTVSRSAARDQNCPEGATDAGRCPGIGVANSVRGSLVFVLSFEPSNVGAVCSTCAGTVS